jgi:hypothetical protein
MALFDPFAGIDVRPVNVGPTAHVPVDYLWG